MRRIGLVALMGLAACPSPEQAQQDATWHADVQPLYAERCGSCHTEGGIAPFSLDTREAAIEWGEATKIALADRTMPPWLATGDGTCGDFDDNQWLTDDEIAMVAKWLDDGGREGDPADAPVVQAAEIPQLTGEVWEYTTPVDFVPEIVGGLYAPYDEYRCFLMENPYDKDVFVTGFDVLPGNEATVHHVLGMPVTLDGASYKSGVTNAEQIANLAALDDRAGWPCLGTTGDYVRENGIPVGWAPGGSATHYPQNAGIRLTPGESMVIQVHYNLVDPETAGQTDGTLVRVEVAESVDREGFFMLPDGFLEDAIYNGNIDPIPPREASHIKRYTYSASDLVYTWSGLDLDDLGHVDLYGVNPHMHSLGRRMSLEIDHKKTGAECAVDVQQWDFNWQRWYWYEEPIELGKKDQLTIRCEWSTEDWPDLVLPGWGTYNEMCLMGMFVVLP